MSNPNPAAHSSNLPRWFCLLLLVLLAGYGVFLARHSTVAAGGSDSSGYLNSARLLASGRLADQLRVPTEFGQIEGADRLLFTPYGFYPAPEGTTLPPTYPPGLPLFFAAASKVAGWTVGPLLVEVLGALGAIWLLYLTARELGIRPGLAIAGAAVLAACPLFIFLAIQPLSDLPATTWVLAAVYAALRARHHAGWAAACGALFAIAVLVRATNSVVLPALVVFLGADWRRLALLVAGGVPGAVWLAAYNFILYGHPARSGYGDDIYSSFAWAHIPGALVDFARWLAILLPAIILALPLAIPLARGLPSRFVAALALWFVAVIGFFASVAFSHESWWSLRYILPAVPALILAALLGLEGLAGRFAFLRRPGVLHGAAVCLVIWATVSAGYWTRKFGVFYTQGYENVYADASRAAARTLPAGSLVVSAAFCGALHAYTDFPILRFDQIDPGRFERFAALAAGSGRTVAAVLFEVEEAEALRARCPGTWTRVGGMKNVSFWRLSGPAPAAAPK